MEEVLTIAISEDYDLIECFNFKSGDVAGYKFTSDQWVEFVTWLAEDIGDNNYVVFSKDRIAVVNYDGEQGYIEDWSIRIDETGGLAKFYDCWEDNPYWDRSSVSWYDEDDLICDIIRCFKNTDNIVFNTKPIINYYEYDEDE